MRNRTKSTNSNNMFVGQRKFRIVSDLYTYDQARWSTYNAEQDAKAKFSSATPFSEDSGWTLLESWNGYYSHTTSETVQMEDIPKTRWKGTYNHVDQLRTKSETYPFVEASNKLRTASASSYMKAYYDSKGKWTHTSIHVTVTLVQCVNTFSVIEAWSRLTSSQKAPLVAPSSSGVLNQALFNALPDSKPDISGLNFLWELKDFKELAGYLGSLGKRLKEKGLGQVLNDLSGSFLDWLEPEYRKFALMSQAAKIRFLERLKLLIGPEFSRTFDLISDSWLSWIFALKPFISDSVTISALGKSTTNKLDSWRKAQCKTRRSRGKATSSDATGWTSFTGPLGSIYRFKKSAHVTVVAVTEISTRPLRCPELDHFMSEYGMVLQPSTIWNAIPFSWLVDQFCNAGDIVASLDSNMSLYQNARFIGSSYCVVQSHEFEVYTNDGKWIPIGRVYTRRYSRSTGSPFLLNPPQTPPGWTWKVPSVGQAFTDLAVCWKIFS